MPDAVLQGETHHIGPTFINRSRCSMEPRFRPSSMSSHAATLKVLAGDDMLLHVMQEVYKAVLDAKIPGWRKIQRDL